MRISHRYRFVFIAIPRTGSTSIRATLDDISDVASVYKYQVTRENPFYNHISAAELKPIFSARGWDWDSYTKFCVVRNPFDRAVSLYHHKLDTRKRTAPGKSSIFNYFRSLKYNFTYNKTFSEWLDSNESQKGLSRSVKEFTHDISGNCLVDHFLKFENIDIEFSALAQKIGFPNKAVQKVNATVNRNEYRSYYNDETKSSIQQRYAYEIETFGYEF